MGWEIFDRTSLGTTHFLNQVNYQRALQNEIRRTLREIDGILDAHVILDLPDQEPVFWDEVKPPSAAITLKLAALNILSPRQISAIANLVAGTVVGMSVENITIIDNFANDLTELMQEKSIPPFRGLRISTPPGALGEGSGEEPGEALGQSLWPAAGGGQGQCGDEL